MTDLEQIREYCENLKGRAVYEHKNRKLGGSFVLVGEVTKHDGQIKKEIYKHTDNPAVAFSVASYEWDWDKEQWDMYDDTEYKTVEEMLAAI